MYTYVRPRQWRRVMEARGCPGIPKIMVSEKIASVKIHWIINISTIKVKCMVMVITKLSVQLSTNAWFNSITKSRFTVLNVKNTLRWSNYISTNLYQSVPPPRRRRRQKWASPKKIVARRHWLLSICYLVYKQRHKFFNTISNLMAAIVNFLRPVRLYNIHNSRIKLLDLAI